jgi:hypothetical protein
VNLPGWIIRSLQKLYSRLQLFTHSFWKRKNEILELYKLFGLIVAAPLLIVVVLYFHVLLHSEEVTQGQILEVTISEDVVHGMDATFAGCQLLCPPDQCCLNKGESLVVVLTYSQKY